MRFTRQLRYDYTVTDRKRSAAIRWQRRQRDALPLLGQLIAEAQPSIDEVMDKRVSTWITSQQSERDRRAGLWRRGRRALEAHPRRPFGRHCSPIGTWIDGSLAILPICSICCAASRPAG